MNTKQKLNEVAEEAHSKRGLLIEKYKKQGRGNVKIELKHGFEYLYGETIPTPRIMFPGMGYKVMDDLDFFNQTMWKK